jgi:orotidine-5'-phosphate decarboxylase
MTDQEMKNEEKPVEETIAKITNNDEFIKVCKRLAELSGAQASPKSQGIVMTELKAKLEAFMRKRLTDLSNTVKKGKKEILAQK